MSFDVFISYSSKNKPTADAVKHQLASASVRCWMAPDDVGPGKDWALEIINAIEICPIMVLIWTKDSMASREVPKELNLAMQCGSVVIPFRLENIEPSGSFRYHLSSTHWLDAFDQELSDGIQNLCALVLHNLPDRSASEDSSKYSLINQISSQQDTEQFAAEQEAERIANEEKAKQLAAEEEAERIANEEKAKHLAAEQEAERIANEEKAKQLAAEKEAERIANEEKAKHLAAEQEAERIANEEKAKQLAAEKEAERIANERKAKQLATKQEAERIAHERKAKRLAAKQEAVSIINEQKEKRLAVERIINEQKEKRLAAERAAQLSSEQEAERIANEQKAEQLAAEQAAQLAVVERIQNNQVIEDSLFNHFGKHLVQSDLLSYFESLVDFHDFIVGRIFETRCMLTSSQKKEIYELLNVDSTCAGEIVLSIKIGSFWRKHRLVLFANGVGISEFMEEPSFFSFKTFPDLLIDLFSESRGSLNVLTFNFYSDMSSSRSMRVVSTSHGKYWGDKITGYAIARLFELLKKSSLEQNKSRSNSSLV